MTSPQILGPLASTHERLCQLVEDLPASELHRRFVPTRPAIAWLFGRSVYLETYFLRELIGGDAELTDRVRHLFGAGVEATPEIEAQLPPKDHLLNWAQEIFDEHLTRLANPELLPHHPLLEHDWLPGYILQRHAQTYEQILAALAGRAQHMATDDYQVHSPLNARVPVNDSVRVEQGHYRIGARDGVAMDIEQPMQMVELHPFRIARQPVANAEYLAFIHDGGYQDLGWWDADGQTWLAQLTTHAPWHWRRDRAGHWYAIGLNGPTDLTADTAVSGLSAHEARAYAAWAAARGENMSGAVPQHEYQWEIAARQGLIEGIGQVWEWCANTLHPYPDYQTPQTSEACSKGLDSDIVLRGACLHTQPSLRRASYRGHAPAAARDVFAGLRLVLPPGKAAWEDD